MWKRTAAGIAGIVAIFAGIVGCAYALSASPDIAQFEYLDFGYWIDLVGIALMWILTFGSFALGADFLKFAISGNPFRVPPRLRAISVGVLSFFPGFLFSLLPAIFYESWRHPNDQRAALAAFAIGVVIGTASAVIVCTVQLKKSSHPRLNG